MRKAIHAPWIDLLGCGGLSILVCAGVLGWFAVQPPSPEVFSLSAFAMLSLLLNYPHFMASYRILYASRENVLRYPWSSLWVPALLVLAVAASAFLPQPADAEPALIHPTTVGLLFAAAAVYLAWHYTGQAWGMTVAFGWIAGIRYDLDERLMIRGGYRMWLAWHVAWALKQLAGHGLLDVETERWLLGYLGPMYDVLLVAALLTFPLGVAGFVKVRRRTGIAPPLRAIVPWVAIYFWYLLIHFDPNALVLVQVFHALQYLVFTSRVDLNRYVRKGGGRALLHLVVYYVTLLVMAGIVATVQFVPARIDAHASLFNAVIFCINIHHYFLDGAIWKISNPEVRRDLFAHLA